VLNVNFTVILKKAVTVKHLQNLSFFFTFLNSFLLKNIILQLFKMLENDSKSNED